ncbi:hypothetical protein QTH97_23815 [Variovorax sp. J22R24]|nr:hypothetical protein [Variovorax sp. J22R24]MDM0107996.1 hypothetical protein [Variovorax sp. J22R24]
MAGKSDWYEAMPPPVRVATAPHGRHAPIQAQLVESHPMRVRVAIGENHESPGPVTLHRRECTLEVFGPSGLVDANPCAQRALPGGDPLAQAGERTRIGIRQDGDQTDVRHQFVHQLQALGKDLLAERTDSGDVAAGPRHRHRETHDDRVVDARRDDGHGARRILDSHRCGRKRSDEHIGFEPQQLLCQRRQAVELAVGRPDFEDELLTLDVPELLHAQPERLENRPLHTPIDRRLDQDSDARLAARHLREADARQCKEGEQRRAGRPAPQPTIRIE